MTIKRQRGRAVKEARCREGHKERETERERARERREEGRDETTYG